MAMNVIDKKALKAFWEIHSDAQEPLEDWYNRLRKGTFRNFQEIKEQFAYVDHVSPDFLIFNIKGNHYRIIATINYTYLTLWIKHVYTHSEYDLWKKGK